MLRLWVYGYLNNRFGQVGDVGNMCPATLFKLVEIINTWKPHMESFVFLQMELLLLDFGMELNIYMLEYT